MLQKGNILAAQLAPCLPVAVGLYSTDQIILQSNGIVERPIKNPFILLGHVGEPVLELCIANAATGRIRHTERLVDVEKRWRLSQHSPDPGGTRAVRACHQDWLMRNH